MAITPGGCLVHTVGSLLCGRTLTVAICARGQNKVLSTRNYQGHKADLQTDGYPCTPSQRCGSGTHLFRKANGFAAGTEQHDIFGTVGNGRTD